MPKKPTIETVSVPTKVTPERKVYCGATIVCLLAFVFGLLALIAFETKKDLSNADYIRQSTVRLDEIQVQIKKLAEVTKKPATVQHDTFNLVWLGQSSYPSMSCEPGDRYAVDGPSPYWRDEKTGQITELDGAIWYWIRDKEMDPEQTVGHLLIQNVSKEAAFKVPSEFKEYYRTKSYIVWTDINDELMPKGCHVWLSLPIDYKPGF